MLMERNLTNLKFADDVALFNEKRKQMGKRGGAGGGGGGGGRHLNSLNSESL